MAKPPNVPLNSCITCIKVFVLPSALNNDTPNLSICAAALSDGLIKEFNACLIPVPACEPLTPLFAKVPSIIATSCMLYPKAPATGATYLNDSPSKSTVVFDEREASANTFTNSVVSSADLPNAVKLSVTISDTLDKSSPDAAPRASTPGIPA